MNGEGTGLTAVRRIDVATMRRIDVGGHADAPAAPLPAAPVRRDQEYHLGTRTAVYRVSAPLFGGEPSE